MEILERPQIWIQRLVSAVVRADRPRAADVARLRGDGIVLPLSGGRADWVHRREVEHVEAELLDVGQQFDHSPQAAERARKYLVPRAEARAHRIDHDLEIFFKN